MRSQARRTAIRLAWCLFGAAIGIACAQASWPALLDPVLLGVGSLMAVAFVWSRLYPGLAHYPVSPLEASPPSITWGGWSEP